MENRCFHRPSMPSCTLLPPLLPGQRPSSFRVPYTWLLPDPRWCSWGRVQCLELLADDVPNQVRNLCSAAPAKMCSWAVHTQGHTECPVLVCVPLRWFVRDGDRPVYGPGTGGARLGEARPGRHCLCILACAWPAQGHLGP